MKALDLYEAMNGLSEEYIDEALGLRPKVKVYLVPALSFACIVALAVVITPSLNLGRKQAARESEALAVPEAPMMLANPWTVLEDAAEAERRFEIDLPKEIGDYKLDYISSMADEILEFTYVSADKSVTMRRAVSGYEHLSGVYMTFDQQMVACGEERSATYSFIKDKVHLLEVSTKDYEYTLYCENGLDASEADAFIEAVIR